jgi:hypothetical protein
MNTKPRFINSTTATRKNLKPVAPLVISELDRQARADTYLEMAHWVKALPTTKRTWVTPLLGRKSEQTSQRRTWD